MAINSFLKTKRPQQAKRYNWQHIYRKPSERKRVGFIAITKSCKLLPESCNKASAISSYLCINKSK